MSYQQRPASMPANYPLPSGLQRSVSSQEPDFFINPGALLSNQSQPSVTDSHGSVSYANQDYPKRRSDTERLSLQDAKRLHSDIKDARWSWCSTVFSAVTLWLCCPFCGFLGLLYSILAYVDHRVGYYGKSQAKRLMAWGFVTFGMIIGVLIITGAILVFVVYWSDIVASCGSDLSRCFGNQRRNVTK